jgi:hypothetical protein
MINLFPNCGKILSYQSSNFSHGRGAERTGMSFLGMRKSINPMEAWVELGAATVVAAPSAHRP